MGFFGKRKEDESIESASEPEAPPPPPEAPKKEAKKKEGTKAYGIDQLVQLMRRLPNDNIELVVRVLKETLESVKIEVPGLIADAEQREKELTTGIADHRRTISDLEEELAAKKKAIEEEIEANKKAIEELEAAHKEVTVVKDRLNLGLALRDPPPAVTSPPSPKPSWPVPPPSAPPERKPITVEAKPAPAPAPLPATAPRATPPPPPVQESKPEPKPLPVPTKPPVS